MFTDDRLWARHACLFGLLASLAAGAQCAGQVLSPSEARAVGAPGARVSGGGAARADDRPRAGIFGSVTATFRSLDQSLRESAHVARSFEQLALAVELHVASRSIDIAAVAASRGLSGSSVTDPAWTATKTAVGCALEAREATLKKKWRASDARVHLVVFDCSFALPGDTSPASPAEHFSELLDPASLSSDVARLSRLAKDDGAEPRAHDKGYGASRAGPACFSAERHPVCLSCYVRIVPSPRTARTTKTGRDATAELMLAAPPRAVVWIAYELVPGTGNGNEPEQQGGVHVDQGRWEFEYTLDGWRSVGDPRK
jgi:hypothetical protein